MFGARQMKRCGHELCSSILSQTHLQSNGFPLTIAAFILSALFSLSLSFVCFADFLVCVCVFYLNMLSANNKLHPHSVN